MSLSNKISIIGGDLRIIKLSEMLIEEGVEVYSYGLEKAEVEELNKFKLSVEKEKKQEMNPAPVM